MTSIWTDSENDIDSDQWLCEAHSESIIFENDQIEICDKYF